jgi:hypothetical protein
MSWIRQDIRNNTIKSAALLRVTDFCFGTIRTEEEKNNPRNRKTGKPVADTAFLQISENLSHNLHKYLK